MKKLVIATSVLMVLAGASYAQSATIYGKLDMGYGVSNGGDFEGRSGRNGKFQQWGSARLSSRWGIRGSEDLGKGYQVFFKLESLINPENGATGGRSGGFDRAAYVGISGPFGSIQAGRQDTLHFKYLGYAGPYDVHGGPNMGAAQGNVGLSAPQRLGSSRSMPRVDSGLSYSTPVMGGFQVHALVSLKNDRFVSKNLYSVAASYKTGEFSVTGVYESKINDQTSASWGVGLKYKFSTVTIAGGYFDCHYKDDGKGFYLGASVPLNAFTVGGQVAYNTKAWSVKGGDKKLKPLAFSMFTNYNLSKRTQLYSIVGYINKDTQTFQNASRKLSASMGITHDF